MNQNIYTSAQGERTAPLREGEVYRATVKERLPNNEAILQVRGREVHVQFEDKTPPTDRITMQITGEKDDILRVRTIAEETRNSPSPQTEAKDISRVLRSLGAPTPSTELRQAAQLLLDKGVPLTKEGVRELQRFFDVSKGAIQERMATIEAMANKRIEVTRSQLNAVHEALHGRPLGQVLSDLAKSIDPSYQVERKNTGNEQQSRVSQQERPPAETDRRINEQIRQIREQVQREPNVQRALEQTRQQVVNNHEFPREVRTQVGQAVEESQRLLRQGQEQVARERLSQALQQVERNQVETTRGTVAPRTQLNEGRPQVEARPQTEVRVQGTEQTGRGNESDRGASQQIRQAGEQLQREANVQRAAEQVRQQVVNNPAVPREDAKIAERAVREAIHLEQTGRERLVQVLTQLEKEAAKAENQQDARNIRIIRDQVLQGANLTRISEQITSLLTNSVGRENINNLDKTLGQAKQLEEVGKARLAQVLNKLENELARMETSNGQKQSITELNNQRPSEMLQRSQQILQRESNFERAAEQIKQQVLNNVGIEQGSKDQLEKQLIQSKELKDQGRELAARQQLMDILQQMEQRALAREQSVATEQTKQEANQYNINEALQTSVQLNSKDIAVTTITEKLAQAAFDFKKLQREITRNLDAANRLLEQFKAQAQTQVKPLLETIIKKLDNAILKSEMMLFADMKTEKRLMQASSELAEARKLLAKGNFQEANRIVQNVKELIEKINYKPSETKVMHFVSEGRLQQDSSRSQGQQVVQQVTETLRYGGGQEASARNTFEMIRSLGLNRDSEIGQFLASTKENGSQEGNQNLKTSLLQLLRGEDEGSRISQQASQALNNLTGQQLLSKADTSGNLQSMFFNLPFLLEEKVENLQVFVNSRNEGQQVDWENCNLYFLIETPKLGEIGILLNVVDRHLSVTLKNDQSLFKEKMEPLVEKSTEKIAEVGYIINGIKYTNMTPREEKKVPEATIEEKPKQQPVFTEKGFDFKI